MAIRRTFILHGQPDWAVVAQAYATWGEEEGLRLLDNLEARGALSGYHLLPAARADLLRRLGRAAEAADAYRTALGLAGNRAEQRFLQRRLSAVEDSIFWPARKAPI